MRTAPLALLVFTVITAACDKVAEPEASPEKPVTAAASGSAGAANDPQEIIKDDLKPGTGDRVVKKGDEIKVNYVGKLLKNGSKFDENTSADDPFTRSRSPWVKA
jgi:FKBP-type peptidyl-prolyl cis-trans isomerase